MIATVKTDNKGTLNLRKSPVSGTEVLAQIPYGTQLEAEKVDNSWSKVTFKGKTGYVMNKFLSEAGTSAFDKDDLQAIYNSLKTTLSMIEKLLK